MLSGTAGRRELLTWANPGIAVVFEDLPQAEEQAAETWLSEVRRRVDEGLRACGFSLKGSGAQADETEWLLPAKKWRAKFEGWITAPLDNRIYTSRPYFDFRAVAGDAELGDELRESVHALLAEHPGFLQLLANDCLAKLPPLTFYRGLVVEDGGASSENLDLRHAVILPLVDTARVFGLRWGQREPGTWERFAAAERREPGQERLFAAAREAYRIASAHRGRLGLAAGDAGSLIDPTSLSKEDQQILKGAFRTIVSLLHYAVEAFDLGGEEE
jgi:CBS domain-containing protein